MSENNGTLMDLSDDNSTSSENWPNASMYYSLPITDPEFQDCKPTILKTEITVSLHFRIIITQERPLVTRRVFLLFTNWVFWKISWWGAETITQIVCAELSKKRNKQKILKRIETGHYFLYVFWKSNRIQISTA